MRAGNIPDGRTLRSRANVDTKIYALYPGIDHGNSPTSSSSYLPDLHIPGAILSQASKTGTGSASHVVVSVDQDTGCAAASSLNGYTIPKLPKYRNAGSTFEPSGPQELPSVSSVRPNSSSSSPDRSLSKNGNGQTIGLQDQSAIKQAGVNSIPVSLKVLSEALKDKDLANNAKERVKASWEVGDRTKMSRARQSTNNREAGGPVSGKTIPDAASKSSTKSEIKPTYTENNYSDVPSQVFSVKSDGCGNLDATQQLRGGSDNSVGSSSAGARSKLVQSTPSRAVPRPVFTTSVNNRPTGESTNATDDGNGMNVGTCGAAVSGERVHHSPGLFSRSMSWLVSTVQSQNSVVDMLVDNSQVFDLTLVRPLISTRVG